MTTLVVCSHKITDKPTTQFFFHFYAEQGQKRQLVQSGLSLRFGFKCSSRLNTIIDSRSGESLVCLCLNLNRMLGLREEMAFNFFHIIVSVILFNSIWKLHIFVTCIENCGWERAENMSKQEPLNFVP